MAQILLVTRDGFASGLRRHITCAGIHVKVVAHVNASGAAILSDAFDALIIDASFGDADLDVVRAVRTSGNLVPIVLLSSKGTVEDRANGLNAGADSYFTRPYSPLVLVAQVRAHIRRSTQRHRLPTVPPQAGPRGLRINIIERSVSNDEKRIYLPPRENALLRALSYRHGAYVSAEVLLRMAWGEDFSNVHVVASCVRQVRRRLTELGAPQLIESKRGFGYRLSRQVVVSTAAPNVPGSSRPLRDGGDRAGGTRAG